MSALDLNAEHQRKVEQKQERYKKHRVEYLKHESAIRSLSLVYLGFGILLLSNAAANSSHKEFMVTTLLSGAITLFVGYGLYRIAPWSRVAAGIIAVYWMLTFNVWTIVFGYVLYLLICEKGGFVFSEPYQLAIQMTPDLKWRWSLLSMLVVAMSFLGAVLIVARSIGFFI